MYLAKHRRARNKKYDKESFPKGILDVIEADYTDRYVKILEEFNRIETSFSEDEWIDILTKARNSHESDIKRMIRKGNI